MEHRGRTTDKGPLVLDSADLAQADASGKVTSLKSLGGSLYFAQDLEKAADGSLFIADTTHGQVLHVSGTATQTISCLNLPEGYCYPSEVRVAPNGDVYAIVRKRWGYKGGASQPLSELSAPDIWMGRLARIDTVSGTASLVDVRYNGVALPTDSVASCRRERSLSAHSTKVGSTKSTTPRGAPSRSA